jgi:hypothetical protein
MGARSAALASATTNPFWGSVLCGNAQNTRPYRRGVPDREGYSYLVIVRQPNFAREHGKHGLINGTSL